MKAPGFGERRKAILDDMAVLFNATVISADIGRKLDSVEISDLADVVGLSPIKTTLLLLKGRRADSD